MKQPPPLHPPAPDSIIHYANDGKWPSRSDDPRWMALIEGAGVCTPTGVARQVASEVAAGGCGQRGEGHTHEDIKLAREAKDK